MLAKDFLQRAQRFLWSLLVTNLSALIVFGMILYLTWALAGDSKTAFAENLLVTVLGMISGWAIGMFVAPYSAEEAAKFSSVGQALSAFVSGYLLSKIDRYLEAVLFTDKLPKGEGWIKVGLFSASFMLLAMWVFTNRAYMTDNANSGANRAGEKSDQK